MWDQANLFFEVFLKFFFLLTPFGVVTTFLALTRSMTPEARRSMALRTTAAIIVICFTLYLVGQYLFQLLGITLDAFRIGAGVLLFLSGADMVRGTGKVGLPEDGDTHDMAVVPMAIPVTVGPATTGALLIMSAEPQELPQRFVACGALLAVTLVCGSFFLMAARLERVLGVRGLVILSKLTGLFLASLAAQIAFTGVCGFLGIAVGQN
jgi:multiple antibiotic resistance protein